MHYRPFIFIKENTELTRVYLDEIIRLEADNNFVIIYLTLNRGHKPCLKFKVFAENTAFMKFFVKMNRSHILNPCHIKKIIGKTMVEMEDGKKLDFEKESVSNLLTIIMSSENYISIE